MRRVSSQRFSDVLQRVGSLTVLALLLSLTAYSQSLGDIARENRDKKAADEASPTPPKVITNASIASVPNSGASLNTEASASQPTTASADSNPRLPQQRFADQRFAERRDADQRAAQQWKRQIRTQAFLVANLQSRVDHLKGSMHFEDQNAYNSNNYSAVMLNRYQGPQLQVLKGLQQQLNQQKAILEGMQDEARRSGMHTRTYDP